MASRGYSPSGVGGALPIGAGLIGKAAERRTTVRVACLSRERTFAEAVRHAHGQRDAAEREIPLPGLSGTESQLVVPLVAEGQLIGVLCLQSETPGALSRADEEIVGVVAQQLATGMARLGGVTPEAAAAHRSATTEVTGSREAVIRHYAEDDSVFVDNHYLIKGVAGRVLWLLLRAHQTEGRREFSNRELRLDARLGLPQGRDNLETRLIMLRKRLEEKCDFLRLRRLGRGRFAVEVDRKLRLEQG